MKKIIVLIVAIAILLCSCAQNNTDTTPQVTEEQEKYAETAPDVQEEKALPLDDKIIVIDAGHGINSYNKQEPIAPNSTETKIAFASGTSGKNQTEEQLNLKVSKKLEILLCELGAEVHMTRVEHESDMTNIDRAEFANNLNADLSVKIHADGIGDSSVKGISMLIPSNKHVPSDAYDLSKIAGDIILKEVVSETNGISRGLIERSDLTGFNWSKVPIILLEMGFMTNPEEDALLDTDEYQLKIAQGLADGIVKYFERNK